jgi:phosphatidylserine synthase
VQRYALAVLFTAIATSLALVAVWSALEGGRAWVVAVAAAALAVWMGDLARRVWPSRQGRAGRTAG